MRVNVYAEELTNRVEIVEKRVGGTKFTGLRFYLELPVTVKREGGVNIYKGPFQHHEGDDDSAAGGGDALWCGAEHRWRGFTIEGDRPRGVLAQPIEERGGKERFRLDAGPPPAACRGPDKIGGQRNPTGVTLVTGFVRGAEARFEVWKRLH